MQAEFKHPSMRDNKEKSRVRYEYTLISQISRAIKQNEHQCQGAPLSAVLSVEL